MKNPVDLSNALARFDDVWSPRVVTQVNDYDVRVAKVVGEFVWHAHEFTDEFFMVLTGELSIALRDGDTANSERVVVLGPGQVFVVPRGVEHRPSATVPTSIMLFEPTGTLNVGDRHDVIPEHVDATTGRVLD